MLNYLWAAMILLGIVWGAFHGNLNLVTEAILDSAKEAVTLGISMLGIMAFWNGILEVGSSAGLIESLSRKMKPVFRFLFPKVPDDHPAMKEISVNMIANMLGVGMAATPAGIRAMEELEKLEEEREKNKEPFYPPGTASDEMCTFLIINISSLQLIPINMIAYRAQYGSVEPTAVIGPALAASAVSTLAAVIFCRMVSSRK